MNWKSDIIHYLGGAFFLFFIFLGIAFFIPININIYIWALLLYSLIYLPLLFAYRFSPREKIENKEKEEIIVMNDISHFREIVNKAMNENAVSQRDVELRLLNILAVDLSIKYDLPESYVKRNLGNKKFMEKLIGKKGITVKEIYDRRHELKKAIGREDFLKDINILMEVMK